MNESFAVIVNGNILAIPTSDITFPSRMRWWLNIETCGDDPQLESIARTAWYRYSCTAPLTRTWRQRAVSAIQRFCWTHDWALRGYWLFVRLRIRFGA